MEDNSIIYLTIALLCAWLIFDNFYGSGYIKQFIDLLFAN